jgi:putative addiction module component (TIGR02574 family)
MAQPQARNWPRGLALRPLCLRLSLAKVIYFIVALNNLAVAEEALSLSPVERIELAKLLIQSLEGDSRTDEQIKAELNLRLKDLLSGKDSGLNFEQVFGTSL